MGLFEKPTLRQPEISASGSKPFATLPRVHSRCSPTVRMCVVRRPARRQAAAPRGNRLTIAETTSPQSG
jgi:hypothetical protein